MKSVFTTLILLSFFYAGAQQYDTTISAGTQKEAKPTKKEKKEIETLFSNAKPVGAFISTEIKATEFYGRPGLMAGSSISLVFGHKFNFGVAGYGLITDVKSDAMDANGNPFYLTMGYGGFVFEPVIASHKMIHITIPVLVGAGAIGLNEYELISYNNDWDYQTYGQDYDFFLVAEPGINLELNVFKILRVDAGVSYRFPGDAKLLETNNSDLKGLNTNITLKLGVF